VTQVAGRDTRSEILDKALELFTRQGYAGTSLRDIADAVGFTKAALYYHFPAKEDLLLALLDPVIKALDALVTGEHTHPASLLAAYLDFIIERRPVVGFVLREPAALDHPALAQVQWDLIVRLRDRVAGPGSTPDDRVRAACALGAVHMAVLSIDPENLPAARDVIVASACAALAG